MRQHTLTPRDEYIRELYAPEAAWLRDISDSLTQKGMTIHVSPEEGKLLQLFVRMSDAKQIVEIGTLGGYSALWMAAALPGDGHITTFEKNTEHAAIARTNVANSPYAEKITLIEGNAHEQLQHYKPTPDMVFIDAEKTGYPDYLTWATKRLPVGGLVVADNTLLFNTVYVPKPEGEAKMWLAMRQFNAQLARDFDALLLPTAEGLSIGVKRAR
jgi:predicted O-methyltransferase YrrM